METGNKSPLFLALDWRRPISEIHKKVMDDIQNEETESNWIPHGFSYNISWWWSMWLYDYNASAKIRVLIKVLILASIIHKCQW